MAKHRDVLPGRIVVISFTAPQMVGRFEDELQLGLEMFADPERATYEALGFGRGSVGRVWLHPRVWMRYASLLAGGARFRGAQALEADSVSTLSEINENRIGAGRV